MVYPGKKHKSYDSPNHPWQESRMKNEVELIKTYGLRNKREVWKAESLLREYRSNAMKLLALLASTKEFELKGHHKKESLDILNRLIRYGILESNSNIDDILGLKTENILERRLQTQVLRLGLAKTIRQARQFITHGHISISGKRVTIPSMMISKDDELQIKYYNDSPISKENHPEHPNNISNMSNNKNNDNIENLDNASLKTGKESMIKNKKNGRRR